LRMRSTGTTYDPDFAPDSAAADAGAGTAMRGEARANLDLIAPCAPGCTPATADGDNGADMRSRLAAVRATSGVGVRRPSASMHEPNTVSHSECRAPPTIMVAFDVYLEGGNQF
jgi:hypothetical protein